MKIGGRPAHPSAKRAAPARVARALRFTCSNESLQPMKEESKFQEAT